MSLKDKVCNVLANTATVVFLGLPLVGFYYAWIYPEERLARELERARTEPIADVESTEDQNQDGWPDLTYRDIEGKQHMLMGYKDGKFYSSADLSRKLVGEDR